MKIRFSLFSILILAMLNSLAEVNLKVHGNQLKKVYAIYQDNFLRIPPPEQILLKSTGNDKSNIQVNYNDFPVEAENAFEYAVTIWESMLKSDQPIIVEAHWLDLEGNGDNMVLGAAGASNFYINKPGLPVNTVFYNAPLAEKLLKTDLNAPSSPDIYAYFNKKATWYFGTDGNTPSGQFDFVTVVLHELCHGLGFLGSMTVTDDQLGIWSYGSHYPFAYDQFIYNGNNEQIINTRTFPNPSALLYQQLTGSDLYFDGPVLKYNTKSNASLYAPNKYDSGSSIDHLSKIYDNTENSLMTPGIKTASSIHNPGLITMSIMDDIGWSNIFIDHQSAKNQENIEDIQIIARITPDFDTPLINPFLFFSINNGIFQSKPLQSVNNDSIYTSTIELTSDSEISYFLSVQDKYDRTFNYPNTAPEKLNTVLVGADTIQPLISHIPNNYFFNDEDELAILCEVTDLLGIDTVYIEYEVNGEVKPPVGLNPLMNNFYSIVLNLSNLEFVLGDTLKYRIVTKDKAIAGNTSSHPSSGFHTLLVTQIPDFIETFETGFETGSNEFVMNGFDFSIATGFSNPALNSEHPYQNGGTDTWLDFTAQFIFPIKIHPQYHYILFDEIALIEPGEKDSVFGSDEFYDYVVVEGSKDGGETWFPFEDGWDSRRHAEWELAYNQSQFFNNSEILNDFDLYRRHQIDLTGSDVFSTGDIVTIRFRLNSDPFAVGWGWAIDNLKIQSVGLSTPLVKGTQMNIYPNPVGEQGFSISGFKEPVKHLRIYDMMGKLVFQQKNVAPYENIYVPNPLPGLHILYIEGTKFVHQTKLLFK